MAGFPHLSGTTKAPRFSVSLCVVRLCPPAPLTRTHARSLVAAVPRRAVLVRRRRAPLLRCRSRFHSIAGAPRHGRQWKPVEFSAESRFLMTQCMRKKGVRRVAGQSSWRFFGNNRYVTRRIDYCVTRCCGTIATSIVSPERRVKNRDHFRVRETKIQIARVCFSLE